MAEFVVHVHAKAKAFVDALAAMPRSAHSLAPRGHFARDYNNLRKLALEAEPKLDERLLGKYVPVRQLPSGEEISEASFVEIEAYARQIMEQLALALPTEYFPVSGAASIRSGRGGKPPAQAGKPWSRAEDSELADAFDAGRSIRELAEDHARTEGAIRSRLVRLGKLTLDSGFGGE
jgi:hypothetical protein